MLKSAAGGETQIPDEACDLGLNRCYVGEEHRSLMRWELHNRPDRTSDRSATCNPGLGDRGASGAPPRGARSSPRGYMQPPGRRSARGAQRPRMEHDSSILARRPRLFRRVYRQRRCRAAGLIRSPPGSRGGPGRLINGAFSPQLRGGPALPPGDHFLFGLAGRGAHFAKASFFSAMLGNRAGRRARGAIRGPPGRKVEGGPRKTRERPPGALRRQNVAHGESIDGNRQPQRLAPLLTSSRAQTYARSFCMPRSRGSPASQVWYVGPSS